MAFNISTNKIAKKKLVKKIETKFSGRVGVNEGKIERVLEGQGKISVSTCERVGDGYQLSGNVTVDAIYLNTEKQICSELIITDFNERVRLSETDEMFVVPKIKDIRLSKDAEEQIVATTSVEFLIYGVVYDEIEVVSGEDEACHTLSHEVEVNQLVASANSSISLSSMVEFVENSKVLSLSAETAFSSVVARENYAEVEGATIIDIWILEGEQIKKVQKSIDFKEEIPLLNCREGMVLNFAYYDKSINYVKDENVIDVNVSVAIWAMETLKMSVIDDAFSEKEVLELTVSEFDNYIAEQTKFFSERKTIIIDTTSKKRLDEVLIVGAVNTGIEQTTSTDAGVLIEGKINLPIIYKNYDNDDIMSATLTAPFDILISADMKEGLDLESSIVAELTARVNSYKNKAGKEISLVVDFEGVMDTETQKREQYVAKLEKRAPLEKKKSSIVVYKPKANESVFNIAKNLKISPDVLRAQNPQLEDGVHCSQVVVFTKF